MVKLTSFEKANRVLLFDFSNLSYAGYYAAQRDLQGNTTVGAAIYCALRKAISHLKELGDSSTAVVWVLDEFPVHKRELVPSYKAQRKPLENDPRPEFKDFLKHTRTYFCVTKDNEADDTIASLVAQHKDKEMIIVSADQDLLQLKRYSHVEIFNLVKGEFYEKDWFKKKYGLTKWSNLPLYKACFGDTSDNIKSALPRVRKNTITEVINKCDGTLKSFIHEFWRSYQSQKTKEVFNSGTKALKTNYKIVKLNKALDFELTRNKPDQTQIDKLFKKYTIRSLNKDIQLLL